MKIFTIGTLIKIVISTVLVFPGLITSQTTMLDKNEWLRSGVFVVAAEKAQPRKIRKTPAMRERVYSQLARAQKLADENKADEGLAVLDRVKSRINQLNSYEKAMLWNFYGFVYYGKDDTDNAVIAFENVVQQQNIPNSLELSTLFSLAQLSMAVERYNETLNYLNRWAKAKVKDGVMSDNGLVLRANAYYALKDYQQSLNAISMAVKNTFSESKLPKENWLVLKRALHYELKQSGPMLEVSEQLVRYYSKPKYWIELANIYGETEQLEKQLATMEAAYQQGFVTKRVDIQTLAQLYFGAGAPYKSAELLSNSIASGLVLENIKILNYLAQAWMSAKEVDKAVPVLQRAAKMSKSGNLDARLAEAYIELEQWQKVVYSANNAKLKGNLDNPGNVDVALGIAYFNLEKYSLAIKSFEIAKKEKGAKKMAEQWLKYVEKEKHTQDSSLANVGT